MRQLFAFAEKKQHKFWSISVQGKGLTAAYGNLEIYDLATTRGQISEKSFADEAACRKEADKLIAEKLQKGYVEQNEIDAEAIVKRLAAEIKPTFDWWEQAIGDFVTTYEDSKHNRRTIQVCVLFTPKGTKPEMKAYIDLGAGMQYGKRLDTVMSSSDSLTVLIKEANAKIQVFGERYGINPIQITDQHARAEWQESVYNNTRVRFFRQSPYRG